MRDLLIDKRELEGVDLFVFRCNEHAPNPEFMKIARLEDLFLISEVTIHVGGGQEEALVLALIAAKNLNHPINHLRSKIRSD